LSRGSHQETSGALAGGALGEADPFALGGAEVAVVEEPLDGGRRSFAVTHEGAGQRAAVV
jgi:hypothetical protein